MGRSATAKKKKAMCSVVERFEPKVHLLDRTKILMFISDEVMFTFSRIADRLNSR